MTVLLSGMAIPVFAQHENNDILIEEEASDQIQLWSSESEQEMTVNEAEDYSEVKNIEVNSFAGELMEGFSYTFDDYLEGAVYIDNPTAALPYKSEITMSGRPSLLKGVSTDKGTSLWFNTNDIDYSYLYGQITNVGVTKKTVVQFDVKPLGVGTSPLLISLWDSEETVASYQNSWIIYPDGTLRIYARGNIGGNQCYTQGASVPLIEGSGSTYTGTSEVKAAVDCWTRLAAVYDCEKHKINYYVNGELIFSEATFFNFGNTFVGGWRYLRMQMDKDSGYATMTEEQRSSIGMYVDNLKMYAADEPEAYTPDPGNEPEPEDTDDDAYFLNHTFDGYNGGNPSGLSGRFSNQLDAVQTEYGTSLWMRSSRNRMIETSGSATDNYFRPVLGENLTDDLVMQADFKPIGGENFTFFSIMDANSKYNGGIRVYNNGKITYYSGSAANAEELVPSPHGGNFVCPPGNWVNVAVVFKVQNKTIDIYIDRMLMVANVPFYEANGLNDYRSANIQQTIYNDTLGGTLPYDSQGTYIDNLKIYKGGGGAIGQTGVTLPVDTEALLPEDEFEFIDVEPEGWATEAIYALYHKGIIAGVGDRRFLPNAGVTREQFVKMIVCAFDIQDSYATAKFEDVSMDDWSYSYIASAVTAGVISGFDENRFGYGENITREDAAVIIQRVMNIQLSADSETKSFDDDGQISEYAKSAIYVLVENGIINGMGDNHFAPKQSCSRSEAVQIIYKSMQFE